MSNTKKPPLVKCAECMHAKVYREFAPDTGRYVLKVNCVNGHWKIGRKHGACDLHRVMARRKHGCKDYLSSSENEEDRSRFLGDLATSLPIERVLYEPNGEPVDILEASCTRTT